MVVQVTFGILWLLCCGYAGLFGGRDGRFGAAILGGGAIATGMALTLDHSYRQLLPLVLGVDLAILVALGFLLSASRRFWPIWLFGLHLIAVTAHIAAWLSPAALRPIYHALVTMGGMPMLLIMAIGIYLDRAAAAARLNAGVMAE